MTSIDRRQFLTGCSAAIAALAGSHFRSLTFADPGTTNRETLVVIFLRGGMDGCHAVCPLAGSDRGHYEALRPSIAIPAGGTDGALALDERFGLHPVAAALHEHYLDGRMGVVLAAGQETDNKSHFDAMARMEAALPESAGRGSGWLARHLASAGNLPVDPELRSLAIGALQPGSLISDLSTLNLAEPQSFNLNDGPQAWLAAQQSALEQIYSSGETELHRAGRNSLAALDLVASTAANGYTPANGASYPSSDFGNHLQLLAQMVKLDLGLQVATVDLGGWDHHDGLGGVSGPFATLFENLTTGLAALLTDLDTGGGDSPLDRTTVVVMSEFGRELRENSAGGTEHGYGNCMFVLGGSAIGGVHGSWPGIAAEQLWVGTDLAVTTDYRRVLSEVLIRRLCNPRLGEVFPGYHDYEPLGIVEGVDLPVDTTPAPIFEDSFESGTINAWSRTQG